MCTGRDEAETARATARARWARLVMLAGLTLWAMALPSVLLSVGDDLSGFQWQVRAVWDLAPLLRLGGLPF